MHSHELLHIDTFIEYFHDHFWPNGYLLPRAHAQGVKQSVCPSVVVVVGTKIARSRVLGICACYKHNESVDIDEKLVSTRFELLKWL